MSRGLGKVERQILEALRQRPDQHVSLLSLAYLVEGRISDLTDPAPWFRHPLPLRVTRVSVARAVCTLERQQLITTIAIGRYGIRGRSNEVWLNPIDTARLHPSMRADVLRKPQQVSVAKCPQG